MFESFGQDIYKLLCQKHPNCKIYVIGDHHFFHSNIINYTRANFSNVLEMNQYIINSHNKTIDKEDIVIFLGDFSFKNEFIKSVLAHMNGYKYLILGNHDSENLIKHYYDLGFEGVFKNPIKIKDDYLSHEPLREGERTDLQFQLILKEFKKYSKGKNYHGHIHFDDDSLSEKYKNATCEILDYKPILIGYTKNLYQQEDYPLFINSSHFDEMLTILKEKHKINPNLLLSDYIYSLMLEIFSSDSNNFFVQGSYALLKKYNFMTKLSDLDISFIYNPQMSKTQNYAFLKTRMDNLYESLKQINGINLSFLKRYDSIRILEALYTSKSSYFTQSYLDANLIFLDCYKETDFLTLESISMVQKLMQKRFSKLVTEYQFPHFQARFLTVEGDIANLLLQILFQQGQSENKELALKKLKYVYNKFLKDENTENFSNIFTRFFLRNIAFLYTMRRFAEIEYIQRQSNTNSTYLSLLPINLQYQIDDILNNPNSEFFATYNEVASTPVSEIFQQSSKIIKKLK